MMEMYFLNIVYSGGNLMDNYENAELKRKEPAQNVNDDMTHQNDIMLFIHSSTFHSVRK